MKLDFYLTRLDKIHSKFLVNISGSNSNLVSILGEYRRVYSALRDELFILGEYEDFLQSQKYEKISIDMNEMEKKVGEVC